ncbi:MAG: Hsp70 family protein [Proteobacteria bacterium]|nr:Hsp70 family protein [Pseudomonadota bacterium]
MRLGIDFGTTRTVVVAAVEGNYPVCSFDWGGQVRDYVPSLAAVRDGRIFYGWDAVDRLDDPESRLVRSLKRLMGPHGPDDELDLDPGLTVSMMEVATGFLEHVRTLIIEHGNLDLPPDEPLEIMAATPANANGNQRYMTLEAFRRAGFKVLGALNEPSAAAIEYAHRYLNNLGPRSPKEYIVVYDLGGGTFDTAVVGLAHRGFEVLAHEGIARLGGDDFDEIILDLALEKMGLGREELSPGQTERLLEECRERKEGVRSNTRKLVVDPNPVLPGRDEVVLSLGPIEDRSETLVRQTLKSVQAVIRGLPWAGLDPENGRQMAAIYVVGGSAAFPPVSRGLRALYASKVKTSPFPHAATAIGLAVAADEQSGVQVRESVSRYFGVWREERGGSRKVFDPIFTKDARLAPRSGDLVVYRVYRPSHNIGHLRFLECGSLGPDGEPAGDITLWPDVFFPYDPELGDRPDLNALTVETREDLTGQDILETYLYDSGGIIQVEIENRTAGYIARFTLNPSRNAG